METERTFYLDKEALIYVEMVPVYYAYADRTKDKYDQLWRLGIRLKAGVADQDEKWYYAAAVKCIKADGKVLRWPTEKEDFEAKNPGKPFKSAASRDIIIGLFFGLKSIYPQLAKLLAGYVKWRISDKFGCTPSLWFWLKYLQHEKKRYRFLCLLFFYIETVPAIIWTVLICCVCNVKDLSTTAYKEREFLPLLQKQNWLTRQLLSSTYPGFALFLSAMMLHPIGHKSAFMRVYAGWRDVSNYAVRMLFGAKIQRSDMIMPPAWNDLRWQRHLDKTCDVVLRPINPTENLALDLIERLITLQDEGN